MIVVRFKARCQPEKIEEALAAFRAVIAPSRSSDAFAVFSDGRHRARDRPERRQPHRLHRSAARRRRRGGARPVGAARPTTATVAARVLM